MNIRNFSISRAVVATTIALLVPSGAYGTCSTVLVPTGAYGTCSTDEANALGCDAVLRVGHGGQPDNYFLDTCSYDYNITNTLCVPSGNYSQLSLHYVEGTDTAPITIINCGGQVIFDGRNSGLLGDGWWNTFTVLGSKHIHLSGAGDPSVKYGFVMRGARSHGVHFDEGCSDIEINNVETYENEYAGMICYCLCLAVFGVCFFNLNLFLLLGIVVRTYPRCDGRCGSIVGKASYERNCTRGEFVQKNTGVHNNVSWQYLVDTSSFLTLGSHSYLPTLLQYVHDTPGEGLYIGTSHFYKDEIGTSMCSGETWAQPELKGVHIYNNRIEDTGRDGMQIGAAVEDVAVHHNTIKRFAYKQDYGDANAIGMNPGSTG